MGDRLREEKAKKDAEAAKLFSSKNEQDFSNVTKRNHDEQNDEEEISSNLGMGGFVFADNQQSEPKEVEKEKEKETESASWGDIGGGFSSVQTTDGFGNVEWGQSEQNESGFGSFADSEAFDFGKLIKDDTNNNDNNDILKETEKEKEKEPEKEEEAENDDNGNYTLKAIVNLEEVTVCSGHEDEKLLKEVDVLKVYRWGKDVTSQPGWKNRATKTSLKFYQHSETGKIRVVCRENITNKLRLNQLVANKQMANIEKKSEKQVSWSGVDLTIAEEDGDDNSGFCMFAAKFADAETGSAFYEFFVSASDNNASL